MNRTLSPDELIRCIGLEQVRVSDRPELALPLARLNDRVRLQGCMGFIVGQLLVVVTPKPDELYIDYVGGVNAGSYLNFIKGFARELGLTRIACHAPTTARIRLYQRLGFTLDSEHKRLVMEV